MDGALVAQWVAIILIAGGLIYNIRRNGKRDEKLDIALKTELKADIASLKEKLDDPNDGLKAIKKSVDDQKLHCAKISTALKTRVNGMEQDLSEHKKE